LILVLQLELVRQTRKRIPSRISRGLIAGASCLIQVLTTARAKPFAVRRTEGATRQGQQHLLPHHILQQKTALFIITDFGLIRRNGTLPGFGIGLLRPENQVKIPLQWYRNRIDATRTQNLKLRSVMGP